MTPGVFRNLVASGVFVIALGASIPASGQPAPPPSTSADHPWLVTVSGGVALTSGNRDTSTINAGYDILYDPKSRNQVKSDGLYLRGKTEGEVSADRLGLNGRDEYQLVDGVFVFGQLQFVRDRFKLIDYLWSPTAGLGYRLLDTPATKLTIDAGVGGVWEKNPGTAVQSSGAVTADQKFSQKISETATLTESAAALYKTDDFSDALYVIRGAVAASMSTRTQLKVEVVDTYQNKLIAPTTDKNDVALVVALVYKH